MLLAQSERLTLLTSYELMYEDDALAALSFGPIDPVPAIGITMRENWLPTQLQGNFLDLVRRRIVGSLAITKSLSDKLKDMGLNMHDYYGETT